MIIETQRLILRKYTVDDAAAFLEFMSDEETNTFLPWFPLKTIDEAKKFIEERFMSPYRYAVCLKSDNKPIGYICLSDNESKDFGYCLKKDYWNQGIITEASAAVIEKIKNAGYPFITATHDVNNPRSGEVMKKLGMTYKYSYIEQWQPKNIPVTFRMYQLNFTADENYTYMEYWDIYENHFVE